MASLGLTRTHQALSEGLLVFRSLRVWFRLLTIGMVRWGQSSYLKNSLNMKMLFFMAIPLTPLFLPHIPQTACIYLILLLVSLSCLTVCEPGLQPSRLLCPWDSPGKTTGMGCHFPLQGILLTQGLNPGLLHCRQILFSQSHQGSINSLMAIPLTQLSMPHTPQSSLYLISFAEPQFFLSQKWG